MTDIKDAPDRPAAKPVWDQNGQARDETRPTGTSGWLRGMIGEDWLIYAGVSAVAIVIGIVGALSAADDIARRGGEIYDPWTPLLWDMTSIAVIILLTPALLAFVRRIRREPALGVRVAVAIAAIIAFSAVHITGMVWLRKLIMFLAGGAYDFRFSLATVLYEFRKDVVTCVLIGGGMWLMDARREANRALQVTAAPAASPPSAPQSIWLRDGAKSIRIEPQDILWISSAGNYIEYSLADGSNHLIRGTLSSAESELSRFNLARIHRTRLANLDRVTAAQSKPSGDFDLTFDTGHTVQGSRRYRSAVASLERA